MMKENDNNRQSRRHFLQNTSVLLAALPFARLEGFAASRITLPDNKPEVLVNDPRIQLQFGNERMVLPDGLQPSMLCTKQGTLVLQSQISAKPHPQERIFYPYALSTVVSRDGGDTWNKLPLKAGDNGVNMEGGIIQLRDGTIIVLETYVTPGAKDEGKGLLYYSNDDYKTLQGPVDVTFNMPGANFYGSTDDGGRPHAAMRLHRRILELPNGDLLTTIYGWLDGDEAFSEYAHKMKKSRVMLFRSKNKGRHWDLVSTIAADGTVGTEGFGEPVITRVSKGPEKGKLICLMRTGREMYEAVSHDDGKTWSKAKPLVLAGIDIRATQHWAEMFKGVKRGGIPIEDNPVEFLGAVVDPELLELRNGVLVAAYGVRIPARACWTNPKHPWNGNYLAFSLDQGNTWSHIVRMTSGVFTTHYMAVEEMKKNNRLFVAYDFGHWTCKEGRYTYGRPVTITINK
jgi:hypothetical protein